MKRNARILHLSQRKLAIVHLLDNRNDAVHFLHEFNPFDGTTVSNFLFAFENVAE